MKLLKICALMAMILLSSAVRADESVDYKPLHIKFCIFDPLGENGEAWANAQDLALEARKFNIFADLKVYTDEGVAAEDFKAGQCDGVGITSLRARQFNKFIGSIDSIGGLTSYADLRLLLNTLANPKVIPYTISGPYQVIGVAPLGAAYVFVRDKSINSVDKAAGKKVAVMDWDKSQAYLVQQLGAQPVASDITNFAGKFNNGQVDILVAPAIIYRPLELYRGLGTQGAIYRFPLSMVTATVMINRDRLLKIMPDLDQRLVVLRNYAFRANERAWRLVEHSEENVDPKYWMDLTQKDQARYAEMMRTARIQLTRMGFYDPRMMHLLKKVRCQHNPANAECSMTDE
ncbi:MAG: hypothetical protein HKM02_08960 [Pseudomonadales bacterium]|nr:hypothetical protein [Pseudomonadales bacterium]